MVALCAPALGRRKKRADRKEETWGFEEAVEDREREEGEATEEDRHHRQPR